MNDRVAFGFFETVRREGLSVPRDVAVVGYDDSELATYANPSITSIWTVDRSRGRAFVGGNRRETDAGSHPYPSDA